MFPAYQVFDIGGTKVGFVGYNDPLTPTRQPPAYSRGIRFTRPEEDLARYVKVLREEKGCHLVFVMSHMGLAQQLNLSNQPSAQGVDYILGADTHERIREPLQGKFCKVTEPGAFASFVGKLDLVIEDGKIKEETYALLDVDPERYPEDGEMKTDGRGRARAVPCGNQQGDRQDAHAAAALLRDRDADGQPHHRCVDVEVRARLRGVERIPVLPAAGAASPAARRTSRRVSVEHDAGRLALKSGIVTGRQIVEWLERELENALAKDPTQRFGGWFVRFSGLQVTFTIANRPARAYGR